jgi:hypothetical protein
MQLRLRLSWRLHLPALRRRDGDHSGRLLSPGPCLCRRGRPLRRRGPVRRRLLLLLPLLLLKEHKCLHDVVNLHQMQ